MVLPRLQGTGRIEQDMSINNVAKLATTSTVSRVINDHPRVAPDTERNVRKAMQELGYAPSDRQPGPKSAARQKAEHKSAAILMFGSSGRAGNARFCRPPARRFPVAPLRIPSIFRSTSSETAMNCPAASSISASTVCSCTARPGSRKSSDGCGKCPRSG